MRHDECNETLLLMYLDGEGTAEERGRIRSHLDACWLCRSRLAALERDLHRIADALAGSAAHGFPEDRIAAAKSRLHAAIAVERHAQRTPAPMPRRLWRMAWIPATAAAFTGGAIWVANRPADAPGKPTAAVMRNSVPPAQAPPPVGVPSAVVSRKPLLPAPAAPSRAAVARLALLVCEAAHALGFDVGKPLKVRIEQDGVRVSGLTAGEWTDLRSALPLEEEAALLRPYHETGMNAGEQVLEAEPISGPDVGLDARLPLHAEIALMAGGENNVKAFADRVVRASESLNRRVHALHELTLALPEADEALLDEASRTRLALLAEAHFKAMEFEAAELRLHLGSLAGQPAGEGGDAPASWRAIAAEWYTLYRAVHGAVVDLFTLHPGREIDRAASLSALHQLAGLEARLKWRVGLISRN